MHQHEQIIRDGYAAFNAGDLAKASAFLAERVDWEDQLEGGMLRTRDQVLDYWTRIGRMQPHTYTVEHCTAESDEVIVVTLIRTVATPEGTILSRGLVRHRYTLLDRLIVRMEILL